MEAPPYARSKTHSNNINKVFRNGWHGRACPHVTSYAVSFHFRALECKFTCNVNVKILLDSRPGAITPHPINIRLAMSLLSSGLRPRRVLLYNLTLKLKYSRHIREASRYQYHLGFVAFAICPCAGSQALIPEQQSAF